MIGALVSVILLLVLVGVVWWAVQQLLPLVPLPPAIRTVIYVCCECPPQHGKSLAVIDFIAWAIPMKGRAEASSLLQRDKVWNWLTDDVFSRFSEKSFFVYI